MAPLPPFVAPTPSQKARIELGKQLFFDPRLSASNQISCASCHSPELGWGDGRRQSVGHDHQLGDRNAPSLLNAVMWDVFFWDGRARTLPEQALFPLTHPKEMNQDLASLPSELQAIEGYTRAFADCYGTDKITVELVADALASFEETIRSRPSRFDRFLGGEYDALTDAEVRGLHLFRTRARCMNCHHGPFFTDQQFHNSGQHLLGRPQEDLGRFAVTRDTADLGKFRTPSLRDIAFTGPYLHHGNILELREVLTMYNSGMPQIIPAGIKAKLEQVPVHDPLLRPLNLTDAEIDDLLAFLEAISVRPRPVRAPEPF
jgi:cytochrome c peroxidase